MFEIFLRRTFSSAHALRHYHGQTEPLHGHNFEVEVIFRGKRLQNKVKYLADFSAAERVLEAVINPMESVNLNETPAFRRDNPSAENIAWHIGRQMKRRWQVPGVRVTSVRHLGNTLTSGTISSVSVEGPVAGPSAFVLDVFKSRQGEGICVGDAQVFIRFGGCNLVCDYCDTPDSIPAKSGSAMDLDDVLERVERVRGDSGPVAVSLTGGEPLLQVEFLEELIPRLRAAGAKIYLETNGSLPDALAKILNVCDWIAMDFKPESAVRRDLWEAHRWFLEMGGSKVFVKMVLTDKTTDEEFQRAVDLVALVRPETPLVLQPATPWGRAGSIPLERLMSWWALATRQLKDVRIIPQIHRLWEIA